MRSIISNYCPTADTHSVIPLCPNDLASDLLGYTRCEEVLYNQSKAKLRTKRSCELRRLLGQADPQQKSLKVNWTMESKSL